MNMSVVKRFDERQSFFPTLKLVLKGRKLKTTGRMEIEIRCKGRKTTNIFKTAFWGVKNHEIMACVCLKGD